MAVLAPLYTLFLLEPDNVIRILMEPIAMRRMAAFLLFPLLGAAFAAAQPFPGPGEPPLSRSEQYGEWRLFCERDRMTDRTRCLLRQRINVRGTGFIVVAPPLGVALESLRISGAMIRIGANPARSAKYCHLTLCVFGWQDNADLLRELPESGNVQVRIERWDGTQDEGIVDTDGLRAGLDALQQHLGEMERQTPSSPPDSSDPDPQRIWRSFRRLI